MSMFKHHNHATANGTIVAAAPIAAPEIQANGAISGLLVLALVIAILLGGKHK